MSETLASKIVFLTEGQEIHDSYAKLYNERYDNTSQTMDTANN
jgi:hypothetical protein